MSPFNIPKNVWQITDLPPATPPSTLVEAQRAYTLLSAALLWISSYEKWVKSTCGDAYRLQCLEKRKAPIIPPQGLDTTWEKLARLCLKIIEDHADSEHERAVQI